MQPSTNTGDPHASHHSSFHSVACRHDDHFCLGRDQTGPVRHHLQHVPGDQLCLTRTDQFRQTPVHPGGGVAINHEAGPYVAITAYSVDFDDQSNANIELDYSAGLTHQYKNNLKLDLGVIRYTYPGVASDRELDYNEYYLGASYKINSLGLSAKYSFSDDFGGVKPANVSNDSAHYIEGALTYDFPFEIVGAFHYGHSDGNHFDNSAAGLPDNYNDYSFGLSKEVLGFGWDLSFYGNDKSGRRLFNSVADEQVVLKINKNF
ncbi:MAG: hypothetical protein HQM02_08045 [Magnetococcales bacterium]|nr:hypothetical protein [Magnetococcales bacterium]